MCMYYWNLPQFQSSHRQHPLFSRDTFLGYHSRLPRFRGNNIPRRLIRHLTSYRIHAALIQFKYILNVQQYPEVNAAKANPYSPPKRFYIPYAPNALSTTPQNYHSHPPHQPSKHAHLS